MKSLLFTLALVAGNAMACPADDVKDAAAPAVSKPVATAKAANPAATRKATTVAADKAATRVAAKSAVESRKTSPL